MKKRDIIKKTEAFVKKTMAAVKEESHGYRHVDRVRKWALKIGQAESGVDLFLLEMAALLHDAGRAEAAGSGHIRASEKKARKYLINLNYFKSSEIEQICHAILYHGRGGQDKLTGILQDADRMDLWGAVVIARAFSSHYYKPYYIDKQSFTGKNWTPSQAQELYDQGREPGEESVIDGLLYNLDIFRNSINTKSAKKLAGEKVKYLKGFIKQFKKETIDLK